MTLGVLCPMNCSEEVTEQAETPLHLPGYEGLACDLLFP